jgi:hypothetical protein
MKQYLNEKTARTMVNRVMGELQDEHPQESAEKLLRYDWMPL